MLYKEKLQYLRDKNNISQQELANILGISRGIYSIYETEYKIFPLKHLIIIANYFNVSLDYIFEFNNIEQYKNINYEVNKIESGKRLKEFRKENKITQKSLADFLNTVHPVIVNYENGKNLIATPFLYMICKKYNVSADYLLGRI